MHEQGPGPVQPPKSPSRQASPVQQPAVGEQVWPAAPQVAGAHAPLRQPAPEQQSALLVHLPSSGWQVVLAQDSPPSAPGTQGVPLQHWSLNWQA